MQTKGRVAIFLSGRGSNFEAIYLHSLKENVNYQIVTVISDKKQAPGLERAGKYGLAAHHISPRKFPTKTAYEQEIITTLAQYRVELICLAGYMRIIGTDLLAAYPNRIMNIHPALLPSFPGLHAQAQAFDYGVKISGCTVHFVDAGMDSGPIIIQQPVEVRPGDTADSLADRILEQEHKIYPAAVELFFENRLKIEGRKVIILS